jgi:hypothetical protein
LGDVNVTWSESDYFISTLTATNSESTATNDELLHNSVTIGQNTDTTSAIGTTVLAAVTVNNDSASQEPHLDSETTPASEAVTAQSLDTSSQLPSLATTQPESTLTTNDTGPMDIDKSETISNLSSSTNFATVAAPAWLTALKMDIYLQECSDEKAWQVLVQSLYKFEVGNTINGVRYYNCITSFLTNSLPVEFTNNLTSRRGHVLDQKQEKKFAT